MPRLRALELLDRGSARPACRAEFDPCCISIYRLPKRTTPTKLSDVHEHSNRVGVMFSVGERDALRERVLGMAAGDVRVVAGALVGSLAVEGGGDRWSDLDLTFAVADAFPVGEVLDDWTNRLLVDCGAVQLVDLV